jgi:hypothetical protein
LWRKRNIKSLLAPVKILIDKVFLQQYFNYRTISIIKTHNKLNTTAMTTRKSHVNTTSNKKITQFKKIKILTGLIPKMFPKPHSKSSIAAIRKIRKP